MRSRAFALALVAVNVLPAASCRRADTGTPQQAGTAASTSAVASPPNTGAFSAHRPQELDSAARNIIGFLRGEVPFDRIHLADTVTFYVSPEGGGTRARVARELLHDRANWKVPGHRTVHSLRAPAELPKLTTRVGRHINCMEYPLSSIFHELARLPHVGNEAGAGRRIELSADAESDLGLRRDPEAADTRRRGPRSMGVVNASRAPDGLS
ncbi:MAG: hypothetical protein ABR499_08940 [Gemmatimonadaceae bacterium]